MNRTRNARRGQSRLLPFLIALALVALVLLGMLLLRGGKTPDPSDAGAQTEAAARTEPAAPAQSGAATEPAGSDPEMPAGSAETPAAPTETVPPTEPPADESWKLVLVNKDHPLPEGFTVELKELRNGQHVDARIYPELQQMFDDARAAGIYPFINESFRSAERQQQILDKYIAGYEAQGMSHAAAEEKALTLVAVPGTSEHQLGLALDLIAEYGESAAVWSWLRENCQRYGFILRYPADKEAITGISYEPWHFRYVGAAAAGEIMERGLCLEEYLAERQP